MKPHARTRQQRAAKKAMRRRQRKASPQAERTYCPKCRFPTINATAVAGPLKRCARCGNVKP